LAAVGKDSSADGWKYFPANNVPLLRYGYMIFFPSLSLCAPAAVVRVPRGVRPFGRRARPFETGRSLPWRQPTSTEAYSTTRNSLAPTTSSQPHQLLPFKVAQAAGTATQKESTRAGHVKEEEEVSEVSWLTPETLLTETSKDNERSQKRTIGAT